MVEFISIVLSFVGGSFVVLWIWKFLEERDFCIVVSIFIVLRLVYLCGRCSLVVIN